MKIGIVGAGLTGLSAGYWLSLSGYQVTIFEKSDFLGGLAAGFKKEGWQWPLEFYFHHIFTSDKEIINLARKVGLEKKIFFLTPKTSIYKKGGIFQFDSPASVLKLPLLSFPDKFRTGAVTTFLKTTSNWQNLEKITASSWLKKYYGQRSYQTLWEPLLKAKFGQESDKISAAWFWARIKKRSQQLGYFQGGFQALIAKLAEKIKENGGEILLKREVKNLNELSGFEKIIFTAPIPVLLKTALAMPENFKDRLEKLSMVGAINLVLVLKQKFLTDNTYWLNINELNYPFVAVVEHTNFIDPKYYGSNHLVYVGGYYPQDHRFFRMSKKEIFQEFLPFLKKINSSFNFELCTLNFELFTNQYAQPVLPVNYSKLIPPIKTPLKNVYLATMHQIYPWDRGTNYAVELGRKAAYEILKK